MQHPSCTIGVGLAGLLVCPFAHDGDGQSREYTTFLQASSVKLSGLEVRVPAGGMSGSDGSVADICGGKLGPHAAWQQASICVGGYEPPGSP